MSLFGHRSEPPRERTAEQRERERIERERRRAAREGGAVQDAFASDGGSASDGAFVGDSGSAATERVAAPAAATPASDAERPPSRPIARTRSGAVEHAATRTFAGGDGARPAGRHLRLPAMPHLHRPGGAPRGARRRSRRRALTAIALVLAGALVWFLVSLFQPFHGGGSGRVIVNIARGASARSIGDLLAREHVVSSGWFFSLRAALDGKRGSFHAGAFALKHDMSYAAALDALTSTRAAATTRVLVPEGYTRAQIAALARADGLVGDYEHASTHNGNLDPHAYGAPAHTRSLEGFLFPATYELSPGAPAKRLVSLQLEAFKRNFATIDLRLARHRKLSAYDVLTIASMVEREAALPSERPLIAAVIYNRLHLRMPLGIDATIRYAFNDYTQPLTEAQLASRSPYNTRLRRGLPPTPIGSPGLAAIAAAAHPANVRYLYYVVKPGTCGQHAFSTTSAQFQRDEARYNSARAKAGGRSPTSCH